ARIVEPRTLTHGFGRGATEASRRTTIAKVYELPSAAVIERAPARADPPAVRQRHATPKLRRPRGERVASVVGRSSGDCSGDARRIISRWLAVLRARGSGRAM